MCRLALINNFGIKHIEDLYGLKELFDYLENQLGGHGNGYCIIYKDGSYKVDKGVKLNNYTIAEIILKNINNIKWIIYHTRLASVGNISDRNCHPFVNNGDVLAMNGTEINYKVIDKNLTDTENILLSSNNIITDTRKYKSVFLGYKDGKVFANKNCGSLKYIPCKNGGKIFASSFPSVYYKYDTVYEAPQYYVEGEKMNILEPAYNLSYNNYITYNDKYYMSDYMANKCMG